MIEGDECPLKETEFKCSGRIKYDNQTKTLFCPKCLWEEGQDKKMATKTTKPKAAKAPGEAKPKYDEKLKAEVLKKVDGGKSVLDVAKEYANRPNPKAIQRWLDAKKGKK